MITPVVLSFAGYATNVHLSAWTAMNREAASWYQRVVGAAPAVSESLGMSVFDLPAGPDAHEPTFAQAMALVRARFGVDRTYSVLGLGELGSGAGNVWGCLYGDTPFKAWIEGFSPRSQLWLLLHEWGHVAGLLHPYGVWNRSDTIMGYASTALFEAGNDVGFTQQELATIRANPLWKEAHIVYPQAVDRPGPNWKRWPEANAHVGAILHSMEGYEGGAWSQLDGSAQAAWHFSVMQDGRVFQHYPIEQSPWHAGNKRGNTTLIGIEHEGVAGEALTTAQRDASVALVRWLAAECGWMMSRDPATRTLWEHREVGTTTCPNGRIPWEYYAAVEQEDAVDIRALDTGETIAAANQIFARFGAIIADNAGETMVEVLDPTPPAGYRTVQITFKEA